MIPPTEKRAPIKMAGYLEKRSKMKVVSRWKKLWFVLEGRLLTYYKSQLEYLSLSPCRGTVNMGLAASVLPGASLEIIVSTRSHTVSLRALNRSDHDVWLQALMDAMCLPNPGHNPCCTKPFHHYRYSSPDSEVVSYSTNTKRTSLTGHSNTLGHVGSSHGHANTLGHVGSSHGHSNTLGHTSTSPSSPLYVKTSPYPSYGTLPTRQQEPRVESRRGSVHSSTQDFVKDLKVDKISRKFSKIAVSDTSIPGKFKEIKPNDTNVLRRSVSVEDEVNRLTSTLPSLQSRYSENVYESLKDSEDKYNTNRISKEGRRLGAKINRSDSDCLMTMSRERILNNHRQFRSEQKIKAESGHSHQTYETFAGRSSRAKNVNEKRGSATLEMNGRQRRNTQNLVPLAQRGVVRSDTDLSMTNRNRNREIYGEGLSNSYDFALLQELIREKRRAPIPLPIPHTKRRSTSILRKFSRAGDTSYRTGERRLSVRKRSLSFLKKLVWKRETKWDLGSRSSGYDTFDSNRRRHYPEMQGPDSDLEIISDLSGMNLDLDYKVPRPEPPPDYDHVNNTESEESEGPHLPPRYKKRSKNSSNHNSSNYDKESGVVVSNSSRSTRSTSPWHDVPMNNQPIHGNGYNSKDNSRSKDDLRKLDPPTLPRKTDKCKHIAQDVLFQDTDPGLRRLFSETSSELGKRHDEINEMLHKICDMAHQPHLSPSYTLYQNTLELFEDRKRKNRKAKENGEDPDYDIPRPHASLLKAQQNGRHANENTAVSNFCSHYDDSLDATVLKARNEDQPMAPDSLEYDPWSLSEDASSKDSWSTPHHLLKPQILLSHREPLFQDSLNSPMTLSDFMHLPHHGYIYG